MKPWAIFAAALCVIGLGYGVYRYQTKQAATEFSVLQARDFELKDVRGVTHRLSDYRDQTVILHFWASWCPPCMDEMPEIISFVKQFEKKGVQLILVSLDQSWEEANSVMSSLPLPANALSLLDIKTEVPNSYGSYQYPETYVIGKNSKILMKWVGPQKWDDSRYKDFINRL